MRLQLILCTAVFAAVGCGGGNDEAERETAASASATATASAGGDSIPAAEWASQVEEICDTNANEAEAEGVRIAQEVQKEGGTEEEMAARVIERGAELTEPLLDQVAELPQPQGKEQQAKEFDQRMRDILPVMREMADTVRGRSSQGNLEQVSQELLREVLPIRALARDLNIHACIPNNARP
jgi:hypothetical protein